MLKTINMQPCALFLKDLDICESTVKERTKYCGTGTGTPFFDIDGKIYPCSYMTPMSFSESELNEILKTNFHDDELFIDDDCFNHCYIYPICPTCAGANYKTSRYFKKRNRNKCRIQKLIALFIADLTVERLLKSGVSFNSNTDKTKLYYTIEAIKHIRDLYLPDFNNMEEN